MKKINLRLIVDRDKTSVRTEQNRYRIFLNWGLTNSFTNKKKAAIFQTRWNAWINETFFEMNTIYASVLFIYRKSWIVIDRDIETKLTRAFTGLDSQFNKLYRSDYRGADGSFYAFQAIEAISTELTSCITMLIKWRRDKKDYEQIKELELLIRQLTRIVTEIKETADPGELGRQITRKD